MRNYLASFMTKETLEQFMKVGLIGIANTIVSFLLFNVFLWLGSWSVFYKPFVHVVDIVVPLK